MGVFAVATREEKAHDSVFPADLAKVVQSGVSIELRAVRGDELVPRHCPGVQCAAQVAARCNILRPQIQCGTLLRDTPGPQPIDEHPESIVDGCRLVDALQLNRHGSSVPRPGADALRSVADPTTLNEEHRRTDMSEQPPRHRVIDPSILYTGTPVMLIGTCNPDGSANLAPASSYWALEKIMVIGLEAEGQSIDNVVATEQLTVNFPPPSLWRAVEAIADTTGRDPVPAPKAAQYRHVSDKFRAAGLTPVASELVAPPRVAECDLQVEAAVRRVTSGVGPYHIVEAEAIRVHAAEGIIVPGTEHIDPRTWRPTIYSFRHYFDLGDEQGHRPGSDVAGHRPPSQAQQQ